ncbi:glycosyltransferase [Ruoffia sp. FAM 24228]|uniref:glycosyltransferase n=1 Tax=Ruoffia sp. FAM 24228 TaxID=3259517 RepID=UPI003885BE24
MRTLVINTAASEGGALSVLTDFVDYLKENDKSNEWLFLLSDFHFEETENIKIIVNEKLKNKINRLKFDYYLGRKLIRKYKPDVIFNMQNTAVRKLKMPQVLYLHQALPFQKAKRFSFLKKDERNYAVLQYVLGKIIKNGLKHTQRIIVQAEWMKESVMKEGITEEKIDVIPPTTNIPVLKKYNNYQMDNFFYPTSDFIYKNIEILEDAAELINELPFNIDITIKRKFANKHLNSIGYISRKEVFQKYNHSVLVFPSIIETYGMPLMEAKHNNSVIIAADTVFAREILKDYNNAYFFPSDNPSELSELMRRCILGTIVRKKNEDIKITNNSWCKVVEVIESECTENK